MKDFNTFQKTIGVEFNDLELLRQAFTHRSYLNEHRGEVAGHNERLEFLGDAVLELISTHFLYDKYPQKPEGELTAYRASLVNAVTCAEIAHEIGMNDFLLLSRGEAKDTGRARNILLANAFEAELPRAFRFMTRGLGTREQKSPDMLSLLMFQQDYIRRLLEIGEHDAEARAAALDAFLAPLLPPRPDFSGPGPVAASGPS